MKQVLKITLFAGILATLIISACSKSSDSDSSTPAPTTSSTPTPTFGDGWGMMAAVTSVSYQVVAGVTIPVIINTATAAFQASAGSTSYVDAGTVTLNSKALTKSTNNVYIYDKLTDPLDFTQVTWSVSGAGSVPAINYTDDKPIPDFSGYNSLPSTVDRSSNLIISLSGTLSDCDTVYVLISGSNGKFILKSLPGSASECKFSAAELSVLAAGTGLLQVAPWNYKSEDISSKKFYFVNEKAYTKTGVTIN